MKALVFKEAHQPIALEEVTTPTAKAGEVIVDISTASLNHRDVWMTKGLYPKLTPNVIPGSCGAGMVAQRAVIINPNINWGDDLSYPDHSTYDILGMPTNGTFAEQIAVSTDRLFDKPAHLSMAEAAAIPLAGLTAYRALFTKARAAANDTVLISGIGGGVALFACQFAIAIGAKVYVTSSSQEKIEQAIALGAAGGINYTQEKWPKKFGADFGGADVVIDSAGGEGFENLLRVCNPQARVAVYGGTRGKSLISPQALFFKEIELYGTTMGNDQEFADMIALVDKHKIRPVIDSVYPLADAQAAYEKMSNGQQFGKIILQVA